MSPIPNTTPTIAVLIPCYNEAISISGVISDFRAALPEAVIYVYDNNSTDGTADIARRSGAVVRKENRQGKGHVVRRMFADIEADIYVLVDGDGTYHAPSAAEMASLLREECLDMVVGVRKTVNLDAAYRPGHVFGNRMFCRIVSAIFGSQFTDILSGLRVMSRRFVKSFPALSRGFEIETQLTIHALELALPCAELETPYLERQEGSVSKLRTFSDGRRILLTIVSLFKETRPLAFFGSLALLCSGLSVALGGPVIVEYFETGLVPRFPTAVLASGLGVIAAIFLSVGLTLDTVSRVKLEMKRLAYLGLKGAL